MINKLLTKKIIVCYLVTSFDEADSFNKFFQHYKKNVAGESHQLLVCYKLISVEKIKILEERIKDIKHIKFVDYCNKNDFDFGSYYRVCRKFPKNLFFFLTGSDYPVRKFWLKKIVKHYDKDSLIGTSASYESMFSSLRIKRFYKFIYYWIKYFKLKSNFPKFPNPHIRTVGFLISAINYIKFHNNNLCNSKFDAWKIESGINSLTNFFIQNKKKVYIVNSDGFKFKINEWHSSKTFNYLHQNKFIISDKHIRKYLKLSKKEQRKSQFLSWGM